MDDSERSEKDENAPCSPIFHADDEGGIYCTGCSVKIWIIRDEQPDSGHQISR
jgi:hypothetical protein